MWDVGQEAEAEDVSAGGIMRQNITKLIILSVSCIVTLSVILYLVTRLDHQCMAAHQDIVMPEEQTVHIYNQDEELEAWRDLVQMNIDMAESELQSTLLILDGVSTGGKDGQGN
jgi:uncharacterized protein YigE (DUF2233 family)